MEEIYTILKSYFGYSSFRANQEEIITSVLRGNDTLALLPTGGGKSICFQVPGIHLGGVCMVISPLISLMEDQVFNLKKKGIKAEFIHSGLPKLEIEAILDKCQFGGLKFLYVSPERIASPQFQQKSKHFNISLIAIDEAHCISQWGYDFRPSYLKIEDFLQLHPKTKRIALTATAKPEVVKDILENLHFQNSKIFKSSFERKNLAYHTVNVNNKDTILQKTLLKYQGSAIVYCYTRKEVKRVCNFLQKLGYSADFYHGGLKSFQRKEKQEKWILDQTRIMVATNAFGMGIDKSDVRVVFHYDIPENIENYFQEAGRCGRDEKESKAILTFENKDVQVLKERIEKKFVGQTLIREIYEKLCQHFQISYESGEDELFDFSILDFSKKYDFKLIEVYNALDSLENCGYLIYKEKDDTQSKLKIITNNETVYQFQISYPNYDAFLRYLARSYPGIFDQHIPFQLENFSKHLKTSYKRIIEQLEFLYKHEIIDYSLNTDSPKIHFIQNRVKTQHLNLSNYESLKKIAFGNLEAVLGFLENQNCRSLFLRNYFGDLSKETCGKCSFCLKMNLPNTLELIELIGEGIDLNELMLQSGLDEKTFIEQIEFLISEGKIIRSETRFNFLLRL